MRSLHAMCRASKCDRRHLIPTTGTPPGVGSHSVNVLSDFCFFFIFFDLKCAAAAAARRTLALSLAAPRSVTSCRNKKWVTRVTWPAAAGSESLKKQDVDTQFPLFPLFDRELKLQICFSFLRQMLCISKTSQASHEGERVWETQLLTRRNQRP